MSPASQNPLMSLWQHKQVPCRSKETDCLPLLGGEESGTSRGSEVPSAHRDTEQQQASLSHTNSLSNYLLIFNIILTIFNFALVLYAWHYTLSLPLQTSFYPVHKLSRGDIALLRRPSQFINLEEIYASTRPQPRTFKNWPLVLAPVDPDMPYKALGYDPKRRMTIVGLISPEDREFRVSSKVSTIAQFRAIDFMMEFCQLVIRPPKGSVVGMSNLEVYELKQDLPILEKELTFANRPLRHGSPLALTSAHNDTEWRHNFTCAPDKMLTFEFGCEADSACDVYWWQNKEPRDVGVFIIQSSIEFA